MTNTAARTLPSSAVKQLIAIAAPSVPYYVCQEKLMNATRRLKIVTKNYSQSCPRIRNEVMIEGLLPLLMNKRPMEEGEQTKKKSDVYDPKTDAEKKSHFDSEIGYYVPSDMLEASWREG